MRLLEHHRDGGRPRRRFWGIFLVALLLLLAWIVAPTTAAPAAPGDAQHGTTASSAVAHGTSPALGSMRPRSTRQGSRQAPNLPAPATRTAPQPSPPGALQGPSPSRAPLSSAPQASRNWAGLGEGFHGPQGDFEVTRLPPDPNGAVGPRHYVQAVNVSLAVFDKAGTVLLGPVPLITLWSGLGGLCAQDNNTDPIVLYDRLADRWVISQLAYQPGGPDYECVAVSTSGDPLGSYGLYAFAYEDMNDYPKLSVWPDGYYATYNMFDATTDSFLGSKVCALDRAKMLANLPATQQCVDFYGYSYLPSDLDGSTPPPVGSPNFILGGSWRAWDQLDMYRFHVDWGDPAKSSLTGPVAIPVAAFTNSCLGFERYSCVPQARTTQLLDSHAARTMYRLAYRNYGSHESLVTTMTVAATEDANGQTATRWYEIRSPAADSPLVYQQGTYAPDTAYRWLGSIAMDRDQNMAMGYSESSEVASPTIQYTGRLATDPLGVMQMETAVDLPTVGSQTDMDRWGDYSAMQVDPADDCTFWYTNQYIPYDGVANWRTRIVSFKYPSCLVPQSITFPAPRPTPVTAGTVALAATASSGLPVAFTSLTPGVCTASGAQARLVRPGVCTIRASQSGNQTYAAALPVVRSFTVTRRPQAITFGGPRPTPLANGTVVLTATASSGLPVAFTSTTTDTCTVAGARVKLLTTGRCAIRANQSGNQTYLAAPPVVRAFAITRLAQSQRPGSIPAALRDPGTTLVNEAGARTVQGQPLTATVTSQLVRGDLRCLRLIKGSQRAVSVVVTGRCPMVVRVTYTAPGTPAFYPYRNVVAYPVTKTR